MKLKICLKDTLLLLFFSPLTLEIKQLSVCNCLLHCEFNFSKPILNKTKYD
jgi:hypothetical protein